MLIESLMKALSEDFLIVNEFMDLPKIFDCIPHDLLITKWHVYVFSGKKYTLCLFIP